MKIETPDIERCPECDFGWVAGSLEVHAEDCSHSFDLELKTRFTHHTPRGDQVLQYERIREMAYHFAAFIQNAGPDCREKSLAFTKLEECVMWANAGIARRS